MRAVRIKEHGGPDRLALEEIPDPVPGPGEARIRVRATALNHLDLWVRRGVPGHKFPLPITPGCDAAGIVDEVGASVTGVRPGDEVVVAPGLSCGECARCLDGLDHLCPRYGIVGETRDGADADLLVVPARNLMPRPKNLGFEASASFALTFLTAWNMLIRRAQMRPAERILIHAAGSGVSSAAIQIARLFGGRILATAGAGEKLERAAALGAEETVNYRDEDFRDRVRQWTDGAGADIVLDHIGSDTFPGSLRSLARGGRYVFCGATSGFEMKADFRPIFFKNISILGSTMGSQGDLRRIRDLVEEGRLTPVVDRVLPLEQVAEAHAALEDRKAFGKIVLSVNDGDGG